jgi:hypothetical protein
MRIKLLWFYLFLTEGLVVYSNLSILLLSILCLKISLKTAVNSICLGTCSSCFVSFDSQCLRVSRSGCKVQLLFNLASVFWKFFENFRFLFLSYSPFNQRHHLLNLSKKLFRVGKITTCFISQIYFYL